MLRPTLVLSFGVVLFLTLGPAPSEGIKCFVCGIDALIEAKNDIFHPSSRQFDEKEKKRFDLALKVPCGRPGTEAEVDCSLALRAQPGLQSACVKSVAKSGNIARTCNNRVTSEAELGCTSVSNNGHTICFCNTDLCNSSPTLRQKKQGPLPALGLALLVAYFGFIFAHRI